ncbi:MAG TPA: ubiquitin-like small modifier protein 1, partial [Chthonomonadales bacterium]|nr:ubiquitin-like small modifier protein 1 [Chthonomonadales bacterium]
MAIKLLIPTALQRYAGDKDEIEVSASTVEEALNALTEQFPDLRRQLFTEQGQLRQFVNVYVGKEDMRHLQGLATSVKDGDELSIVPSIAGGVGVLDPRVAQEVQLSNDEILRYSRHLIMPEVALEGQKKLKAASV